MSLAYRFALALAALLAATSARAVPTLQLDILGGTYDSATQTIIAPSASFTLYAYLQPETRSALTDRYFLSMALLPSTSIAGNYGSFTINGSPVNVTSGMDYGTPPLESILGGAATDPGDLSPHGIFPTYFYEKPFQFSPFNISGLYNTQTQTGIGPQAGSGMYYAAFNMNTAGITGYGLHFDLYNEKILTNGDIDVNQFAPFSHDAQVNVPEPNNLALLGLALLGFALARRRSK
jgi:hypothetical protein